MEGRTRRCRRSQEAVTASMIDSRRELFLPAWRNPKR